MLGDEVERSGFGEALNCGARNAGSAPDFLDALVWCWAARRHDRGAVDVRERAHLPKPEPHCHVSTTGRLERAVPMAVADRDRAHLDAVLLRVAADLRRTLELGRASCKVRG